MTGKVIIVTGASAGIGYEVARALCEGGNDVILACRSEERANRSIEKIRKQNPSALATYMQVRACQLKIYLFLSLSLFSFYVPFSDFFPHNLSSRSICLCPSLDHYLDGLFSGRPPKHPFTSSLVCPFLEQGSIFLQANTQSPSSFLSN